MPTLFRHKKAVPEQHASESREECEDKRKVGENTLCASVTIFSFRNLSTIYFNRADEMNWTEKIYGKTFLQSGRNSLVCWFYQFIQKLQRLKFVFVLNCQNLLRLHFSVFQFRFRDRVRKIMVQTTGRFKPYYNGWAQWRHNKAAVLEIWTLAIQHGGFQIDQKTAMFSLISQSLSANSQNKLYFRTLGI